jgi:hypothetical protein
MIEEMMMPEPACVYATVRDGFDEWHVECRFDDGQKFAAVHVDYDFPDLAHRIAAALASPEPLPHVGETPVSEDEVERRRLTGATCATIAGIEQFVGMKWKGLYCDRCDRPYTGWLRSWDGVAIRKAAAADGWQIGERDLCPDCAALPPVGETP